MKPVMWIGVEGWKDGRKGGEAMDKDGRNEECRVERQLMDV